MMLLLQCDQENEIKKTSESTVVQPPDGWNTENHCAKNRIYAIVYFAYISSIRTNIRVRIREISHWYILRIEPISHCVYFEYPQMYHVRYGGFSN